MNFIPIFKSGRKVVTVATVSLAASQLLADLPGDQARLVGANNAFAFDLMNQIAQAQPGANVFVSPFSVSSVLQMVNNGAAGVTKTEMQQVLKTFGMSTGTLNAAFKDLSQQFTGREDAMLNLANGLWIQKGFPLKPAFVADNQEFFQAELGDVDFHAPQSAQTINDWADRQTWGKIKEVVQFPFPPQTRLILANAIYFKGAWVEPFKQRLTRPRDFYLANGQSKPTPMMTREGRFVYQETPDFQAVKLLYKGGFQMELYLPQTNSTPAKLLAEWVAGDNWQKEIQAGFREREGTVTLPKFKIEYDVLLNEPLKALGMKNAFAGDADFSGIAGAPLFISQVQQKSYVDVNEEGTEAAAVTTVRMTRSAIMRPPPDQFTMVLDRPFLFAISDVNTGSILFVGIVNDPVIGGGN